MATSTPDAILQQQLRMTPVTWQKLREEGVTESTPLCLDLFWFADTEQHARALASNLAEQLGAPPSIGQVQSRWSVEAQFGPKTFTLEALLDLVDAMCKVGFAHDCEFDGWGAEVPVVKRKPWWKLW